MLGVATDSIIIGSRPHSRFWRILTWLLFVGICCFFPIPKWQICCFHQEFIQIGGRVRFLLRVNLLLLNVFSFLIRLHTSKATFLGLIYQARGVCETISKFLNCEMMKCGLIKYFYNGKIGGRSWRHPLGRNTRTLPSGRECSLVVVALATRAHCVCILLVWKPNVAPLRRFLPFVVFWIYSIVGG